MLFIPQPSKRLNFLTHPVGYNFKFHITDPRYKRLLLFVPNFNSTFEEHGFVDQSSILLLRNIIARLKNINLKEISQRKLYTLNSRYMGFENAPHSYRLFLLHGSKIRPAHMR